VGPLRRLGVRLASSHPRLFRRFKSLVTGHAPAAPTAFQADAAATALSATAPAPVLPTVVNPFNQLGPRYHTVLLTELARHADRHPERTTPQCA
jgi:hypothetical protein